MKTFHDTFSGNGPRSMALSVSSFCANQCVKFFHKIHPHGRVKFFNKTHPHGRWRQCRMITVVNSVLLLFRSWGATLAL